MVPSSFVWVTTQSLHAKFTVSLASVAEDGSKFWYGEIKNI
jgi:hypothetical protein